MARKKLPRPTYRQHDEDEIHATVRAAIPEHGIFMDYLGEEVANRVEAPNEFERGVLEGRRRLAGDLISIVMNNQGEKQ